MALREVIGGDDARYSRVVFNEILKTRSARHLTNRVS